jgi:hypothetical protein
LKEIKSASRTIRFAIANHSLQRIAKDGPLFASQRKGPRKSLSLSLAGFLWSGFRETLWQYPGNFARFPGIARHFLRRSDWLVALPGIEPGFED